MNGFIPKIVVTSGEPSGIGPDVCLQLLKTQLPARITVLGDAVVFAQRARQLGLEDSLKHLNLISVPTATPVSAGQLNVKNVSMVLRQLDIAVQGCLRKHFDAMVTAPVHKGIINDAGLAFTGHTEYLARKTQSTNQPVMMLSCEAMRVALVTTHIPLAQVPAAITQKRLVRVLGVLYKGLKSRFGIKSPTIGVCGLNPHAGEQGHLGRTEIEIIEPTLQLARDSGMNILGPLPADTAFTPRILQQVDAVLCMYHDQGLPVLKYASFGRGTNITLGLPIIRTSVDHGTALDLAGSGRADPGSLQTAVETAIEMANVVHLRQLRHASNTKATPAPRPKPQPQPQSQPQPLTQPAAQTSTQQASNLLSDAELEELFAPDPETHGEHVRENNLSQPAQNAPAVAPAVSQQQSNEFIDFLSKSYIKETFAPDAQATPSAMPTSNQTHNDEIIDLLSAADIEEMFKPVANEEPPLVNEPQTAAAVNETIIAPRTAASGEKDDNIHFESTMAPHDIEKAVKTMRKHST